MVFNTKRGQAILLILGVTIIFTILLLNKELNFVNKINSISLNAVSLENEKLIESYKKDKSELDIKEAPTIPGNLATQNKNNRMDFNVEGKKTRLYFDLLDYEHFKKEVVRKSGILLAYREDRINGWVVLGENDSLSNKTSTHRYDKEYVEDRLDELDEEEIANISNKASIEADDFDIKVENNQQNKDYKWGYELRPDSYDFIARVKVTSEDNIEIYNNYTLKIGNGLLSFKDLVDQGFTISFAKPIIYDDLTVNVTNGTIEGSDLNCEVNDTSIQEDNVSLSSENNSDPLLENESNITISEDNPENNTIYNYSEDNDSQPILENNDSNNVEKPIENESGPIVDETPTIAPSGEESVIEDILTSVAAFFYALIHPKNSIRGCAVEIIEDAQYPNSMEVYIQKNLKGTSYKEGDLIYLDPTFIIIELSNAMHLDSNKEYLSDIYNDVKALDETYSETVSNGEIVRVLFERNLTKNNDITVYARINNYSTEKSSSLEIYEKDSNYLIANIEGFNGEANEKKVYLTNMSSEIQDSFDLKVLGDSLEFDYIVDPAAHNASNIVYQCGSIDTDGNYEMNQSITINNANCLTISASNVNLDCKGYVVDGNDASTNGIFLNGTVTRPLTNVTINNCTVTDHFYGFYLSFVNNSILINDNASSTNTGYYIASSLGNQLSNITDYSTSTSISFATNDQYNNFTGGFLSKTLSMGTSSSNQLNIFSDLNINGGITIAGTSNRIYNNFINGTVTAGGSPSGIELNTTLSCSGRLNILGGSCIGGNYWAAYGGYDTDNDGVGDIGHLILTVGVTDYHPLVNATNNNSGIIAPVNIYQPGTYSIISNITPATNAPAVYVTSDNVNLLGNNNIITGSSASNTYGVTIGSTLYVSNVSIHDLIVKNYDYPFYINKVNNSLLNHTVAQSTSTSLFAGYNFIIADNVTLNDYRAYGMARGIWVQQSKNITISNGWINGSSNIGLVIWTPANQDIFFFNNNITKITTTPISIASGAALRAKIYNNFFNNSGGLSLLGNSSWNITYSCSSRNYKGGSCIGGNYWAYINGTGFSENCNDTNKDDICDTNYTMNSANIDYLPLTNPNPPSLTISYPVDGQKYVNVTVLNYTVIDLSPAQCWYSTNYGLTNSSIVSCGTNFTNLALNSGNISIRVYANDTGGMLNSTNVNFTINIPPNVGSSSVSGGSDTNEDVVCTFSVNDSDDSILNVTGNWYKNGVINVNFTSSNLVTNTNYTYNLSYTNTTKGEKWSCRITPNDGLANGTSLISTNLTIGNAAPYMTSLQLISPIYYVIAPSASLAYHDYDSDNGQITLKWYVDGINVENDTLTNIADGESVTTYLNSSINAGALINVSAIANDGENNSQINYSSTEIARNIPLITSLDTPSNNSWKNGTNVVFGFTPRSTSQSITSCFLYGNWSTGWGIKSTLSTVINSTQNNFDAVTISTAGTYLWNVICSDGVVNGTSFSSNRTIRIDTGAPSITLLSGMPSNNSVGGAGIIINWSVTDDKSSSLTCYPYYAGSYENATSANNITNGSSTYVSLSLQGGPHNLGARCYDEANNSALNNTITYLVAVINFTNPVSNQTVRYGQTTNLSVEEVAGADFLNNLTIQVKNSSQYVYQTLYPSGDPIHSVNYLWGLNPAYIALSATAFNQSVGVSQNVTQTIQVILLRNASSTNEPLIYNACPNETYVLNGTNTLITVNGDMDTLLLRENLTITAPNGAKYKLNYDSINKDGYNNYNVSINYTFAVNQTGDYNLEATITDMELQNSSWNYTFYSSTGYATYRINSSSVDGMSLVDKCSLENSPESNDLIVTLPTRHFLDLDVKIEDTLHNINLTLRNINMSATGNLTNAVTYNELSNQVNASSGYRRVALFELNSSFNMSNYTIVYDYGPIAYTLTDESTLKMQKCETLSDCTLVDVDATVNTSANTITATLTDFSYFLVSEAATTVSTVVQAPSSGGGTTTRFVGINFLVPSDIELGLKDQIVVPLTVINPTSYTLKGIGLKARSTTTDIDPVLEKTSIESLNPYENNTLMLFLESHSTPGDYEVIIDANINNPRFNDSTVLYVKLVQSVGAKEVVERVVLAQDLFRENPQCLELNDFLIEAQRLIDEGKTDEAREIVQETIYKCKELLTDNSFISNFDSVKEWRTPIIVVLVLLVLSLIITLTIIRPRLNLYKPRKDSKLFGFGRKKSRKKSRDVYN